MGTMQNSAALSLSPQAAKDRFRRPIQLWTFGLIASGPIGACSGITGLLIGVFCPLLTADNKDLMNDLSLGFMLAAFPMLSLTAHCLDKLAALEKARCLEHCSGHGPASKEPCRSSSRHAY